MSRESLAARLLATFLGEMEEQVRAMTADLLALEAEPRAPAPLRSLFRSVHTLKGAAHAAGVPPVEEVCHGMETLLAAARDARVVLRSDDVTRMLATVDALSDAGERLRRGEGLDGSPLAALCRVPRGGGFEAPAPVATPAPPAAPTARSEPASRRAPAPVDEAGAPPAPRADPAAGRPQAEPRAQVRVEPEKLDALLAATGQVLAASSRISLRPAEMQELVERAEAAVEAFRRGGAGADGAAARLREVASAARAALAAAEADARALERASDELSHRVGRVRMRPFADVAEALPRIVRDVAAEGGKEVRLEVHGAEVEADRAVWTAVREAVTHVVRNAVDHGVEPPALREAAGKARAGTVTVAAALRGGRVVVTVADDGAGLDAPSLRARLAERGRPVPEGDGELARALFRGGISSRPDAGRISGRGVGLDSAHAALERIRGSLGVTWAAGRGTTFTLECPPALLTLRVVTATAAGLTVAFPTASVERLVRVRAGDVRRVEGRDVLPDPAGPVPLVPLSRLLGVAPSAPGEAPEAHPVVRLAAGGRRVAVVVDAWLHEEEVLVRPLRGVREPPPFAAGASILATGEVALVLNAAALVDAGLAGEHGAPAVARPAAPGARALRLLVVDDSITTRALEQSILEAAGYAVATAADGAEAWRLLQEGECDLVVSDVEMPRMDGFALCRAIRASHRLRRLPVVLVTALETAEHRAEGLEAGADAYLPKSSFDQEGLLAVIRRLVG